MMKLTTPFASVTPDTVLLQVTDKPGYGCTLPIERSSAPEKSITTGVDAIGTLPTSRTVIENCPAGSGTPAFDPTSEMQEGTTLFAGLGLPAACARLGIAHSASQLSNTPTAVMQRLRCDSE
jgi:hypothetical protein